MGRPKNRNRGRQIRQSTVPAEVAKQRRLRIDDADSVVAAVGRGSPGVQHVSIAKAMGLPTVWACIRLTAQAVASLPVTMFERRGDDDRVRVGIDDDIAEVISDSPNADQTPDEFWEGMVAWMMADGNGYAEQVHYGNRLSSLQPIASTHCQPFRTYDGELKYRVNDRGQTEIMPREKIFHIKGFGFGGDVGLSAIRFGVQTMGSAIARDDAMARMFASGMQSSGVLTADKPLKGTQRKDLEDVMNEYTGSSNAGKMMILGAGMSYQQLTLNPVDVQMLEQNRFGIEEMCRWFGMPPIIVGHAADGQTMWGSGVEQILLSWLQLGLNPLCIRIEKTIKKRLLRPAGHRNRYAEFNREALLQMDSTAKAAFLSSMVQNGLMTRTEGRSKLNLSRIEGGDQLTVQSNLVPLDQLGDGGTEAAARNALRNWLGVSDQERQTNDD